MRPTFALALALTACAAAPPPPPPSPPPPAAPPPAPPPAPSSPLVADQEIQIVFADPARLAKLRTAFSAIDGIGAAELAKQRLPSLAVGVVIDGELAYAKGFGFADVAAKTPAGPDTIYRIGSITKSFTGMLMLALRDDGALSLDDPLTRYVPEASRIVYPTRDAQPITLRQIATHSSGLPRSGRFDMEHGPTEEDVLKSLDGFSLATAPGTRWTYSNLGFSLLAIAASRAGHMPYRELIRKRLLTPLGMTSTAWDPADLPKDRVAVGYEHEGGAHKPAAPWRLGAGEGAGGLYASTRDLARWIAFQLSAYPSRGEPDNGPLKRSTVREAHSTGVASGLWVRLEAGAQKGERAVDAIAETYGFGWIAARTCDFDPMVWHNGAIDGFRAEARFLPNQGVGVIALTNSAGADMESVAGKVVRALLATGGLAPRVPALVPAFAPAVAKLLGLINAWDEVAYAAMLTKGRPAYPKEKDELAGYRDRHGHCTGYKPIEIQSPRRATLALECAKGTLEMTVSVGPDGLIDGFGGTSRDVPIPADERRIADAVVKLISAFDEGLYRKHLAAAFPDRDGVVAFYEGLRKRHGRCAVKSADHAAFDRSIVLTCDRGRDMRLAMTLDDKDRSIVRGYTLRSAGGGGGVCPVL